MNKQGLWTLEVDDDNTRLFILHSSFIFTSVHKIEPKTILLPSTFWTNSFSDSFVTHPDKITSPFLKCRHFHYINESGSRDTALSWHISSLIGPFFFGPKLMRNTLFLKPLKIVKSLLEEAIFNSYFHIFET